MIAARKDTEMNDQPRKTVLHQWHVESGAHMALFGGYEMPLWYPTGVKTEHRAVLTAAGLFDTSHMAAITVDGADAFSCLQHCFTKDLTACIGRDKNPLSPGRCVYGAYLNDRGYVIDDAIIYQFDTNHYMTIVNAGMGAEIAAHLTDAAAGMDVSVHDLSDNLGKMDVQGPRAAVILSKIIDSPEVVFDRLPYFAFKGHFRAAPPRPGTVMLTDGTPILLSRTGYTGEFGFEIFVNVNDTTKLWKAILDAGREFGLIPCALAARDSLRAGAKLPLSHQDIGPWPFLNHPWLFALPYTDDGTDFTKEFIGFEALKTAQYDEYTVPFAGFDLRKVSTHGTTKVIDSDGSNIGIVLTCATDMAIGRVEGVIVSITSPDRPADFDPKGLSCGFIKVKKRLQPGDIVSIADERRTLPVEIVDDIRPDRTARTSLVKML